MIELLLLLPSCLLLADGIDGCGWADSMEDRPEKKEKSPLFTQGAS